MVSKKEELRYCYEWTINNDNNYQHIIETPAFITMNNSKWYLSIGFSGIQSNQMDLSLHLINSNEPEVNIYVKFNLINQNKNHFVKSIASKTDFESH